MVQYKWKWLVNALIQGGDHTIKTAMEDLLADRPLAVPIDEQIIFNQLDEDTNAIWGLLLATGYLKVLKKESRQESQQPLSEDYEWYCLAIINLEVKRMFQQMIKNWFRGSVETYYSKRQNYLSFTIN